MATEPIVFNDIESTVPDFLLKNNKGKEVRVTVMSILGACSIDGTLEEQTNAVKLYLLNAHQLVVNDVVATLLMEKAEEIYTSVKKNCTSTPVSVDSDSTPALSLSDS